MIVKLKRIKDDIESTIDAEDNLQKMILIEQAIDAAYEIEERISRSYAFCDCVIAILEFARETNNEKTIERIHPLLEEITNKGAFARALSYLSVVLASFNKETEAEEALLEAIKNTDLIKDDFDRRDALLDIATSAGDIFYISNKRKMLDLAYDFAEQLTSGQKAYLYGYIATLLPEEEGAQVMRTAIEIADQITDPITRSKVFLELSGLLSNGSKDVEE